MQVQAPQIGFDLLIVCVIRDRCFEPLGEASDLFLLAGGADEGGAEFERFGGGEMCGRRGDEGGEGGAMVQTVLEGGARARLGAVGC